MKTQARWYKITNPPKKGGEYNTVWAISDNRYPVTTTFWYDAISKSWYYDNTYVEQVYSGDILFWAYLPKPPKGIPKKLWLKNG